VKKFIGDGQGHVKELVTVQIKWEKTRRPVHPPGATRDRTNRPAQLVLLEWAFSDPNRRC